MVNTLLLPYEEPAALLSLTSEEPAARPLDGMENGPRPLPSLIKSGADGGAVIHMPCGLEHLTERDVAAQFRPKAQLTQLVFLIRIGLLSSGHRLAAKHSPVIRLTGVTT